jgi:putative hydrolase of the HAD superfamily
MTIEVIFFDYGGVIGLVDRDAVHQLETAYGLQENDLLRCIYTIPEWRAAERGEVDDSVWIAAANAAMDERAGRPVPELHEAWRSTMWRRLDESVVALVKELRSTHRVAMISNSTKRLETELLEPLGVDGLFDVVVNSARLGIAKPDTRIYHYAAEQMGVEPAACVHIDDLPPNVQGAIDAGFSAIHYQGDFPALTASLHALGVDW